MTKFAVLGLFLFGVSAYGTCWPGYNCPVALPEPSAIPELILGVTGLGYFAWRKRNSAR